MQNGRRQLPERDGEREEEQNLRYSLADAHEGTLADSDSRCFG